MEQIGRLHLLEELRARRATGTSEFAKNQTILYELLSIQNDPANFVSLLQSVWPPTKEDIPQICLIDLANIDLIGPSAASALIEGIVRYSDATEKPCALINVRPEVLEGLQTCRYVQDKHPVLCALDTIYDRDFIGYLQERLQKVLVELESSTVASDETSASALAEREEHAPGKASINRFSVYLQELYGLHLVIRRKVGGSERQDGERGWTYLYQSIYPSVRSHLSGEARNGHIQS